jgi:hypothetical protein
MNPVRHFVTTVTTSNNLRRAALAAFAAASLSACYVVPLDQYPNGRTIPSPIVVAPAAPSAYVLMAKLYPSNDAAGPYGMLPGTVTNHLNGRGEIVVEVFRGEATRNAGSSSGTANGAGTKGGYMSCTYTMNSPTLGRGVCRFNNGAVYNFHLGQ